MIEENVFSGIKLLECSSVERQSQKLNIHLFQSLPQYSTKQDWTISSDILRERRFELQKKPFKNRLYVYKKNWTQIDNAAENMKCIERYIMSMILFLWMMKIVIMCVVSSVYVCKCVCAHTHPTDIKIILD